MGFILIFRSVVTSSSASHSRGFVVRCTTFSYLTLHASFRAFVLPLCPGPPSCATHPAPLGGVSDSIPVVAFLCTR
eukprot:4770166-Pleurochrysis_carterae.AAC.1